MLLKVNDLARYRKAFFEETTRRPLSASQMFDSGLYCFQKV